ncbi:universal stress protein [Streptomyces sp. NPDC048172]|uniref:universal stress protein n=1 Tax=Streptomyces sp. NPDC048172 TaxID=3365505 RepID=UPI003720ED04
MEPRLIVGIDGSESSLPALDWAADEAERQGVPLVLVHAWSWSRNAGHPPGHTPVRGGREPAYDAVAEDAMRRARDRRPGLDVRLNLSPEGPVAALVEESPGALAVVTGTRDHGELVSLLRGSVSRAVAAYSHCPVVVVRGLEANRAGDAGLVTVGIGDVPRARGQAGAVAFALRDAEARHCPVRALRAWRCPAHEPVDHPPALGYAAHTHESRARADLGDVLRAHEGRTGAEVRGETAEGRTGDVLLQATAKSDLLVVGIHRPHRHLGPRLSAVHHALLHHADCPVAFVPEHEPEHVPGHESEHDEEER